MSVTQDYKLETSIRKLRLVREELYDARVAARGQSDWKADEEITCAINNLSSALIALGCAS